MTEPANGPSPEQIAAVLRGIAGSPELIEIGRKRIEDILIEFRDHRIGVLGRGNGFVCREYDSTPSSIIRLGTPEGIEIALKAIADHLGGES